MSSSAGLSSYSSLFASGLHPTGRLPSAGPMDVYAYPYQRSPNDLNDFPANVNARRPSADTESTASRRSSLPTFASDRRTGKNNSYYPPHQQSAAPSAIAFTPSILLRSETTATKRNNFKSFLSMDANDPTQQQSVVPPVPFLTTTTPPVSSQNKRFHGRAVSAASSSVWAPSMLQSPNSSSNTDSDRHSIAGPFSPVPSSSETHPMRRSISVPPHEGQRQMPLQQNQSGASSDKPPRLEIRLDPKASRISFDPSAHDATRLASYASGVSSPQSIPARPEYEPRVRSSLPPGSATSTVSPLPPRSVQRNMSITSASTFVSATPSQRSAIRRVRRNEALARLEGNYYDPAPEVQGSGSFMPFESDEEEEESEVDPSTRRETISSRAKSPPPIKPPSPLRYRSPEQRRFVEIDPPESLFELALATIAEAPTAPQPGPRTSSDSRAPSIRVHESIWPTFDREDEENESPFGSSSSPQLKHPTPTSRTPLAVSPLSSRTNLTSHTANQSSTSLASFTPFSPDFNRMTPRAGSVHGHQTQNAHATGSPYATGTPAGSKPGSGPGSIITKRSISIRSNDDDDVFSEESNTDLGAAATATGVGIGPMVMDMDPTSRHHRHHHPVSRRGGQGGDRDRSGSTSTSRAAHYLKPTTPLSMPLNDMPRSNGWGGHSSPSSALTPTTPKSGKSSKSHKDGSTGAKGKEKEAKGKEGKIRYETYLDMSGDERSARDGSMKKRRWLFGK